MIEYIIPIVGKFASSPLFGFSIIPVLCLAFLATCPVFIRRLFVR